MPENLTTLPLKAPYVFGGSVTGPIHKDRGLLCQDAWSFTLRADGLGVVAVADGLGSAAGADLGARTAVQAALDAVQATGPSVAPTELARQAMAQARERVEAAAAEHGMSLRDLASTLIVVVFQGRRVGVAHIGDGAVVAGTAAGLTLVSGSGDSEYVNEVTPLTTEDWEGAAQIGPEMEGVESLGIVTDGCQRGCLVRTAAGLEPSARFFDPLFRYAATLTDTDQGGQDVIRLLASPRFAEISEDDKTLVIAVLAEVTTSHGTSHL